MPFNLPSTDFLKEEDIVFFQRARDGLPLGTPPHRQKTQEKLDDCKITSDFDTPEGKFRTGMQGVVHEKTDDAALIYIQDVTGEKTWVPLSHVEVIERHDEVPLEEGKAGPASTSASAQPRVEENTASQVSGGEKHGGEKSTGA